MSGKGKFRPAHYILFPTTLMNPLKLIANVLTTLLTLLFLGWYGVWCFRLGWQAKENPFLFSIAALVMKETPQSEPGKQQRCYRLMNIPFGQCD